MHTLIRETSFLSLLEEVASPQQLKTFKKGSLLTSEGQNNQNVYIVKSGLICVGIEYHSSALPVQYILPGEIIGLMGILQAVNYPCYFKTVTESEIYVWDYMPIRDLIMLEPEFALAIKRYQSQFILVLLDRIKSLVFYPPFQRVVTWIAEYNKNKAFKEMRMWSLLTAEDMAAYCHVDKSTFLRYLNDLTRTGVIIIATDDCHVADWEKLSYILQLSS